MQPTITLPEKHKFRLAAFECKEKGKISQKTLDLTPHAGQRIRIWLDHDGTYSTDRHKDHYWQVAELDVPHMKYKTENTGKLDKDKQPAAITSAIPPDLRAVKIRKWDLPK